MAVASGRYFLILNADAWMTEGSLGRLVRHADAHPEAAVVGPRLLNTNGTLQRSVRGFPTLWRLATEYFFLRKLAPRTRLLNGVLRGRLRPRRGARGRGRDGRLHARAPRGGRAGRPARRGVLPLQRGDGLVPPLPPGRLEGALLPGRGVRARRRRLARRPHVPRERARAPALPRQAPRRPLRRARPPAAVLGAAAARASSSATSAAGCTATRPAWLASGRVPELLDR